jgi:hypothetical protein
MSGLFITRTVVLRLKVGIRQNFVSTVNKRHLLPLRRRHPDLRPEALSERAFHRPSG